MRIIHADSFTRELAVLPKEIRRLFTVQEERLRENWRDPRLHIKKVRSLKYASSFRITRRYRVFFYFQDEETVVFFDVDHRKDAYR